MIDPEIDHEETSLLDDSNDIGEDDTWKLAKDKTFNIGIPFTHRKNWSLFGDLEQPVDESDVNKKAQKRIIWLDKSKAANKTAPTASDGLISEETKWTEDETIAFWQRLNRNNEANDDEISSYKRLTADAQQYADYLRMKEHALAWRPDFTGDDSERMMRIINKELIYDTMDDIITSIAEECRVLSRRSVDMLSRSVLRGIMDINDGNQRFLTTSGRLTVLRGTIEDFISNRNGILAVSPDGRDPAFDKLKTFTNNTSIVTSPLSNKNTKSKASILDIDDEEQQRYDLKQPCQLILSLHFHNHYIDYTLLEDAILRESEFLSKMTYKFVTWPNGISLLGGKKKVLMTAAQLFSLPSNTSNNSANFVQDSILIAGYQNGSLAAWRLLWSITDPPERLVVYTPSGRGTDNNSPIVQLTLHFTDPLTVATVSENSITSVFRLFLPQLEALPLPEAVDTAENDNAPQAQRGFFSRLFSCGRNHNITSNNNNGSPKGTNSKARPPPAGRVNRIVTVEPTDLPYQLPPSPADFDEPEDTKVSNKKRSADAKIIKASQKSVAAVEKQTICIHPAITISGQAVSICLAPSPSQYKINSKNKDSTACPGDIFKFNFDVLNNNPEPLLSPLHTAILREEYVRPDQAPKGYLLKPTLDRPRGNYNRVFREIFRFHTSPLLLLASVSFSLQPGLISIDEDGRIAKWSQQAAQLSGCLWWMPLMTVELSKMTVILQQPSQAGEEGEGEEVKEPDAQHVQMLRPQSVRYQGRGSKPPQPSNDTANTDAKLITRYFPCPASSATNNENQDEQEEQEVIIYESIATLIGRTESTVSQTTWTRTVRKLKKGEVKVHAARLSPEGLDLLLLVCITTTSIGDNEQAKVGRSRKNKQPQQQTKQEWRLITINLDTFTIVQPQIELPWLTQDETLLDFVVTSVIQETATRLVFLLTSAKIRVYSLSTSQEIVDLQLPAISGQASTDNKKQKQQQEAPYTKLVVCPSLQFLILYHPSTKQKGYEPCILHMTHIWDGLKQSKYKATSNIGNIPNEVMSRVPDNFLEKYPELYLPAQDVPYWIRNNALMLMISRQIVLPHRIMSQSQLQSDSSAESLALQQQQHDLELEIEEMIHEIIDDAVTESVLTGEDERRRRLILQVFPSQANQDTTPNIGVVAPVIWPPARISLASQKRQRADEVEVVQQQASEIIRQRTEEQLKKVEELPGLEDWIVQSASDPSTLGDTTEDRAKEETDGEIVSYASGERVVDETVKDEKHSVNKAGGVETKQTIEVRAEEEGNC